MSSVFFQTVYPDWSILDDRINESRSIYSVFIITKKKNKFVLSTDNFDELSLEDLKDELEKILSIWDITPSQLQHEILGPRCIQAYKNLGLEKSITDGYVLLLMAYARSPIRDFEITLVGLDEVYNQIILKQKNSFFLLMIHHRAFTQITKF